MFILPNRPEKKNPLNDIVESLAPVAEKLVTKSHRSKLEQQLKNAGTPQDRAKAIESIMLSPHYEDKEKAVLERMFHQERQQAQQAEMLQSIFNPQGQSQGGQSQRQEGAAGGVADLSDEQIASISMVNPQLAATVQHLKEGEQKKRIEEYKLIAPMEKEIYDKGRAAKQSLRSLSELERLNEKGDISHPLLAQASEKLGAPWLVSSDTNLFKKTMLEEMGNLKELFGARPSVFDVQMYLESMPTTAMTPDARRKLIKRKQQINEAALIEERAYKEAKKENPDPFTLRERASERAEEMIDQYLESVKKGWEQEDAEAAKPKASESGTTIMKFPDGSVRKVPKARVKEMEGHGGIIQ
jgi:hypothetical protein